MKMNKKLLKIVMSLMLALVVVPSFAFANDETYTWSNTDSSTISYESGIVTISGDGTLTLIADTTRTIYVSSGTVTIDLAGYTLTQGRSSSSNYTNSAPYMATIYVSYGATATIEDSTGGNGTVKNTHNNPELGAACVLNSGTCTIESGTFYNYSDYNRAYYTIFNHGTMTINGGTFKSDAISNKYYTFVNNENVATEISSSSNYASYNNGYLVKGSNSALITNGYSKPTSTDHGGLEGYVCKKNQEYPELTINGGTFNCTNTKCINNDNQCKVTINNGEFSASYTVGDNIYSDSNGTQVSSGTELTGYSLRNHSETIINGGTFNNDILTEKEDVTLTITNPSYTTDIYDGTFNGTITNTTSSSATVTTTIYHGDFATNVSSYLADTATITNEDGTTTDATVVTVNGAPYTEVHAITKQVNAVEATCTETGNEAYYVCSYCGAIITFSITTDNDGTEEEEYIETTLDAVTIAATGHSYESVVTDPTCTEDGYTTYTCSVCGDTYTDDVTSATGHDYSVSFSWSDDLSSATATITCANDSSHNYTATATVTSKVTTEATYTSEGIRTYTATVTVDGTEYTDTKTESIDKLELTVVESETTAQMTVTTDEDGNLNITIESTVDSDTQKISIPLATESEDGTSSLTGATATTESEDVTVEIDEDGNLVITPVEGLESGDYTVTVTITMADGTTQDVVVTFTYDAETDETTVVDENVDADVTVDEDEEEDTTTATTATTSTSDTEESADTDTSDNTVMYIYALLGLTAACGAYYVVRRREEL